MKQIIVVCLIIVITQGAFAQKQLVLLKREKVVLRLYPGDEITFKLKTSNTKVTSYVNNLYDTAVVTHRDTIPFHKIDRIYFKQTKFYNVVGGLLVVGGAGLFLIDQFNQIVVQGESPSLDDNVTTLSLSAVAVGLPMMLIKKKSQRLGYKYRLLTAKKGSLFYQPELTNYMTPFGQ
ncbi:MAG: hypothetical protein JNM57_16610 [Cyclobacteriaceae bacterium]|nr:hypothetical protein [Cyclobacteriaceae bacterium]